MRHHPKMDYRVLLYAAKARADHKQLKQTHGTSRIRGMKRSTSTIFATIIALGFFLPLAISVAQAASLPHVTVPLLTKEPAMDGRVGASWRGAARLTLGHDYTNRRLVEHPTIAYVAQDRTGLDIAFVVTQHSPVTASTVSNGSSVFGDDNVEISLEPQGVEGFSYQFIANARGARYQVSSENSAYTPNWTARGRLTEHDGYVVTMHIPFAVLRTGGSRSWKAQLERFDLHANSTQVWSYSSTATSPNDPVFSGTFERMMPRAGKRAGSSRPQPRYQPYLLGVARSGAAGGSTSQMGLDMAVPITPTASFVGSFHPDYSNVETDQQTISPTAFPRQYQEVRPFFTQLGTAFNQSSGCQSCPQTLYTPAIPTFRQGYGLEGTQGPVTFAGFDAVGAQRTDIADTVNYSRSTQMNTISVDAQDVAVNTPAFTDNTSSLNGGYYSARGHWLVYGNFAREDGSFVTDPSQAHYSELGAGYKTANTNFVISRQFVGAQFSPVDGYVQQSDIGGYTFYAQQAFHFSPKSKVLDVYMDLYGSRFWNHLLQPAQNSAGYQVNVDLKTLWSFHIFQQSAFVLTSNGEYLPFNAGNGAMIGYNLNSNYAKMLVYGDGPYYHGHAATWQFIDTMPLWRDVSLSLNLNENIYASRLSAEPSFRQWLNSASLNWQFSHDASLSLGARRLNGTSLPSSYFTPNFTPVFADNLSAAFHYLRGHNEFYLVYGDPNAFTTTPAVFFKWIFYAGAAKGT